MPGAIAITKIDRRDFAEWDNYVQGTGIPYPYMLSNFRKVVEDTFHHEPLYLAARRGGIICGVLPVFFMNSRLFGRLFASLPFFSYAHAVADSPEAEQELFSRGLREADKRNVGLWIIRQGDCGREGSPGVPDCFLVHADKVNVRIDLPPGEMQLWEGFRSKLRSQIRKAEKNGLECREGSVDQLHPFYQVFSRNMRDLGTPVYPERFFFSILVNWEESRIISVWKDGEPVGGAFLVGWKGRLEIPWASTIRAWNHLAPNMLLYHSVLKYAVRMGYKTFDFGRSTPGEGTHSFKLQWGGVTTPLPWLYWVPRGEVPILNRRNPKFEILSDAWKRIPLPIANIIGPAIIRSIP